ncbi:MAG: DUF86 domain-containing protein [Bacteroidia bacterium]|nr:DUF86 domain-containing protein [Bacteroidia bacterium]MBP7260997.1 DUF86 domain-containing protein [Bacteroidia bacterium]MBP9180347.1 DUF86 domain-containing protein [Bacteroidia bacterium]MBP9724677.1 DUF86 domain-containing protein [Bacteroidia bacterium]
MQQNKTYPIVCLEHISLSTRRIQEYIGGLDLGEFKMNYMVVDAVMRNFEIIEYACKGVPQSIKEKHPNIPWATMSKLKGKKPHNLFNTNHEVAWELATKQLPKNHKDLLEIIEQYVDENFAH